MDSCPSCPRSRSPRGGSTTRCAARSIESALAPGINALKTFDPPLHALDGPRDRGRAAPRQAPRRRRRRATCALLVHLMSAGRLQLFDKRASLRDRTSRLLVRIADGRELRLREFGTKQAAWVKLLRAGELEADEALATLGPRGVARPARGPARAARSARRAPAARACCATSASSRASGARGSTRSCGPRALSPFKRGDDLDDDEAAALREAIVDVPRRRARALRARRRRCRSPTSCRCRCRSTATTASRARAAARRSRRCTTRTTSCATARPSRPAGGCSRTAACRAC